MNSKNQTTEQKISDIKKRYERIHNNLEKARNNLNESQNKNRDPSLTKLTQRLNIFLQEVEETD